MQIGILFLQKQFQLSELSQLSAVLLSLYTKLVPIQLHTVTDSGISAIIITCFITLSLFNLALLFKIVFTSSALLLFLNFNFTSFIWLNTRSISALEYWLLHNMGWSKPASFCMGFLRWYLHTNITSVQYATVSVTFCQQTNIKCCHWY